MTIGWVQPGTRRGTFFITIGSRKTTPSRMLRIVPLGDFHIFLSLNSFDAGFVRRDGRAFHGDAVFLGGFGRIDGDLVVGRVAVLDRQVVILQVDVEIGQDQALLDERPDDAGHLVAVHFDDGVCNLDDGHEKLLKGDVTGLTRGSAPGYIRRGSGHNTPPENTLRGGSNDRK